MKKSRGLAKRLKKERESLGLSKTDVAKEMGFSNYQTLGYIENGSRDVKAWELFKLAKIYGRSPEHFYRTPQPDPVVIWRRQPGAKEDPLIRRRFLGFCTKYQRLLELTGEEQSEPEFALPEPKKSGLLKRPYDYSRHLAEEYLRLLDLGRRPAFSLPEVLESYADVKLIYLDLGQAGSGASAVGDFGKGILINASDAPWRRNYDLAHELFHIITWDFFSLEEHSSETGKHPVDKWADAFASVLLLPEEETRAEFSRRKKKKKMSYLNVVNMARDFGVSTEALLWRLVNLGLLKKEEVQESLQQRGIRHTDRKQRVSNRDAERPYLSKRYIALAIKAYEMGRISRSKFAEYIDKPFSQVGSFMRRYGYDDDEDYSVEFAAT